MEARLRRAWRIASALDVHLNAHRSAFFGTFIVAGFTLFGMLVFSTLGLGWPRSWHLGQINIADEATLLLAVGTLALAYAGLVQAVTANRVRMTEVWPHVQFRLVSQRNALLLGEVYSVINAAPQLQLEITNAGPGHAVGIQVVLYWWESAGDGTPPPFGLPTTNVAPAGSEKILDFHSMGPNAPPLPLDLVPIGRKNPLCFGPTEARAPFVMQLLVEMRWHSVAQDLPRGVERVGAFRSESDSGDQSFSNWKVMTRNEVISVGGLPQFPDSLPLTLELLKE